MTLEEQKAAYKEAACLMKEAKALIKKAPKDEGYDDFIKYKKDLRVICSTALKALSVSVGAYLKLNDVRMSKRQANDIYYMQELVYEVDCGLGVKVHSAHNILYWCCCCDGMSYINFIEMGFENVMEVINKTKPSTQGAL